MTSQAGIIGAAMITVTVISPTHAAELPTMATASSITRPHRPASVSGVVVMPQFSLAAPAPAFLPGVIDIGPAQHPLRVTQVSTAFREVGKMSTLSKGRSNARRFARVLLGAGDILGSFTGSALRNPEKRSALEVSLNGLRDAVEAVDGRARGSR